MRKVMRIVLTIVGLTFGLAIPAICQAQADANQGTEKSSPTAANVNAADAAGPELASAVSPASDAAAPASSSSQDAQTPAPAPAAAPAAPTPLPTPTMTAPLSTAAPAHTFDAGPLGTVDLTGILSGFMLTGDNRFAGQNATYWDISNAQIFLQKTTGWWQFYLQGGAYSLPALGTPYIDANHSLSDFYGPLPVAYLKLVKGNFSVEVGELPTLIGAEYTFSFENLDVERGLLWNQENAISRGIQLNETYKKLSLSAAWTDGFYSNRYTWITGSMAYAINSANTLSFIAGGNAGTTDYVTPATPIQNNSSIYEVLYTYSHESWYVLPYWQYTDVPKNSKIGTTKGTTTDGFGLLFNYNFKHGISMALRPEYITSSGSPTDGSINLLYGPGSNAFAFTVSPTYQKGGFFTRGDFAVVNARNIVAGDAFGLAGINKTQVRGVLEAGFMF